MNTLYISLTVSSICMVALLSLAFFKIENRYKFTFRLLAMVTISATLITTYVGIKTSGNKNQPQLMARK